MMHDDGASQGAAAPEDQSQSEGTNDRPWHQQQQQQGGISSSSDEDWDGEQVIDARPILPKAAFFMGDLRDGLPMLNMQAAYLISARSFTEKQVGQLSLVFGIAQFLCLGPSGYFLDYSNQKIKWVMWAGCATAALTIIAMFTAQDFGEDMFLMFILKALQGGISSIIPPGYNGITLGIVGSTGFTHQVSRNRMMNHMGTALTVAIASLIAYNLYPNIGHLFIVSPLSAIGMYYNLRRIKPNQVNKDAARALIITSPTMTEYEYMDDEMDAIMIASVGSGSPSTQSKNTTMADLTSACAGSSPKAKYIPPDVYTSDTLKHANTPKPNDRQQFQKKELPRSTSMNTAESVQSITSSKPGIEATDTYGGGALHKNTEESNFSSFPSFRFGWSNMSPQKKRKAQTFLTAILDPSLMTFSLVIFFFHLSNASVLPLVMQSLSLQDPQAGILLSGLCILIAQAFMSFFAKLCGDFSPIWGRKSLILVGLFALTIRCFLLTFLVSVQDETEGEAYFIKGLILCTQLLDSVGAGIMGTLQILVTNDISGGTGRFSLMLGITTGAMCLGGTVSGYIGQALASDYGYPAAFSALGMISLVPFFTYALFMPETLPDYARPKPRTQRRKRLLEVLKRLNAQRKQIQARIRGKKGKQQEPDGLRVSPQTELV